ncbi:symmetrical bis(5'-nucleosyl)-tetraphosphatase [Noviherbaspirillum pedocola]|uniref:Bis(5'-nucleosyl)-tetraphosphatase, symmetrical n=1 Tax=Noviherbaspirillum pedocola TaxID=2801341 RepID=A0A934W5M6_9BURK|nr:symmetrical bis(5'-nucleosyl)-tetraphosphatase [Noviherbaspirillum pedocola]MBK4733393.1 symmetrical bis(5'-nucleosyl)-tetraphosphatase [Noviherbaspirillum pedocola]
MPIPSFDADAKTYAIGDIQGCQARASELLNNIRSRTQQPRLLFAGDAVNRGPESLTMLRQIRDLGDAAEMVLGNHDLHLLAVSIGVRKPGRGDTISDILEAPDCDELLTWLRHRPLALMEQGHLLVHAGLLPQWTAQQAMELAHEVEIMLRGPDWRDFLRSMYGNDPARWDDSLTGPERLRCIVNAMTRLRFCSANGTMDFKAKEGLEDAPPGFMPWFDVPGRRSADTTIVCGHWSTLGLVMRPNLIALDTGCVWGGQLTAVCLENREVLQVDCPQFQRPG